MRTETKWGLKLKNKTKQNPETKKLKWESYPMDLLQENE